MCVCVWGGGGGGGILFRNDDGISSPRTKIQNGKGQIQDILDMEKFRYKTLYLCDARTN